MLPISDRHVAYSDRVAARLKEAGYRVETDAREEKIGKKIREAQLEKVPYMLIMGDKEEESATVAVRSRREGDLGPLPLDEFMDKLSSEVKARIQP
jgi:threonyl-tRNA synthetase